MVAMILSIVAALLPFAVELAQGALAEKKRKEARTYANDAATFDQALADRDADRVTLMFDELRAPAEPGGGDPGGQDGPAAR